MKKNSRKPAACERISAHHMRFDLKRVVKALKAGHSLILTYRNKPVARIEPLNNELPVAKDDPIFHLDELAEPIGPLTNFEIDRLVV
ncbi:MAG TPA: hypothetical protein VE641_13080 [Chthoniobacterales bacterium]|jgi:antitoxin (DNA-binding transcriptional repressor) of toxin-antitoxin stability system|nr:hypothetical protein [Chthoniobacterales bacterium]